jgi:hypothetical protein
MLYIIDYGALKVASYGALKVASTAYDGDDRSGST